MDIGDIRAAYSIYSFQRARQEGKVWQWVFTHLLWFVAKCILFYPIVIIWRWTEGRTNNHLAHLLQFVLFSGIYFIVLWALISSPFRRGGGESAVKDGENAAKNVGIEQNVMPDR